MDLLPSPAFTYSCFFINKQVLRSAVRAVQIFVQYLSAFAHPADLPGGNAGHQGMGQYVLCHNRPCGDGAELAPVSYTHLNAGVEVLARDCLVAPASLHIDAAVPVEL